MTRRSSAQFETETYTVCFGDFISQISFRNDLTNSGFKPPDGPSCLELHCSPGASVGFLRVQLLTVFIWLIGDSKLAHCSLCFGS